MERVGLSGGISGGNGGLQPLLLSRVRRPSCLGAPPGEMGGFLSGPWRAFQRFTEQPPQIHGAHNSLLELVTALAFLAALVPMVRRFPRSWGTHALISVLVPLCSTLWSFGRLSLLTFPAFALAGEASRRHPRFLPAYLSLCLPLGGLLMALFACGWWAG